MQLKTSIVYFRYISIYVSIPNCCFYYFLSFISITAFNENMAWRSSGASHRELIENLYKNGLIKDQRIKEAMLQVDRADFTDHKSDAYDDRPQSSN